MGHFFSDELMAQVAADAADDMQRRVERLRARLDAIEAGLGDRAFEQALVKMRAGTIAALDVQHELADEIERRKRGVC